MLTHHAKALSILRAAGCTSCVIEVGAQAKLVREVLSARPGGGPPKDQMREAVRQALTFFTKVKGNGKPPAAGSSERRLFDAYNTALRSVNAIDFDDMITIAAEALRCGAAPRPQLTHVLLDEAQDTSESQLQLLELLAPPGEVAITIVGDSDQQIYSFRGSRPDVLTRLGKRWGCWTLTLPTNYRCGGAVVEVAKALIEGSSLRETATPLLTARDLAGLGRCAISQSSSWLGMLHQPAAWLPRLLSALR